VSSWVRAAGAVTTATILIILNYSEGQEEDRRKLQPYHTHINVEVVENVYLISSMLLEIPSIVADPTGSNSKQISKNFRKLCDQYNRNVKFFLQIPIAQIFNGPPESNKDFIYAASKSLQRGDWKDCHKFLMEMSIWKRQTYFN